MNLVLWLSLHQPWSSPKNPSEFASLCSAAWSCIHTTVNLHCGSKMSIFIFFLAILVKQSCWGDMQLGKSLFGLVFPDWTLSGTRGCVMLRVCAMNNCSLQLSLIKAGILQEWTHYGRVNICKNKCRCFMHICVHHRIIIRYHSSFRFSARDRFKWYMVRHAVLKESLRWSWPCLPG